MSRVGKMPISLPNGVEVTISKGNLVTVKGPKGTMTQQLHPDLLIEVEDGTLEVKRPTDQKRHREAHGLARALINNHVVGVSEGFVKELELVGVGYRASNETMKQLLELSLGYSHPVLFYVPEEVTVVAKQEKGKNPIIRLESHDKQLIGQIAAKIRAFRKPEPYKGKGVRFVGEEIRRKAGKTAGKK
jgi:large subunit ribosomal protein L6